MQELEQKEEPRKSSKLKEFQSISFTNGTIIISRVKESFDIKSGNWEYKIALIADITTKKVDPFPIIVNLTNIKGDLDEVIIRAVDTGVGMSSYIGDTLLFIDENDEEKRLSLRKHFNEDQE